MKSKRDANVRDAAPQPKPTEGVDKGGFEALEGKNKEDDFSLNAMAAVKAMKARQEEDRIKEMNQAAPAGRRSHSAGVASRSHAAAKLAASKSI